MQSESLGDAHVLYGAGVGAAHLAHIPTAAYIGSTAVAILTSGARWSWLGWIGIGFTPISLIGGVIVLASESHWSDVLGTVIFLAFIAWVFATSIWLVLAMRRSQIPAIA